MTAKTILVVGSGGREHALAWRCAREGHAVHAAPGSDAIAELGTCHGVPVSDHAGLVAVAKEIGADLVIIGPEQPLVDGLADVMRAQGLAVFGPSARAAELEGSKAAAKAFMEAFDIPTARARTVEDLATGLKALREFGRPPVVKADGLAAGKGVVVADTWEEAEAALRDCLEGDAFGGAGARVVLEERLEGEEASFFVLTDGTHRVHLLPSQDHKRIGEGDTGANTGGMGAYVPAPVCDETVVERVLHSIVDPTLAGLRSEGRPFVGVLFVGLMIDAEGTPRVIEYNCRFGDPEVQPLMLGLHGEVVPTLVAAANGELESGVLGGDPAATVVWASAGYPASSSKGDPIQGLDAAAAVDGVFVFHAGSRRGATGWETAGGRVLGVCAKGATLIDALDTAQEAASKISIPGGQRRRDIGHRARARMSEAR